MNNRLIEIVYKENTWRLATNNGSDSHLSPLTCAEMKSLEKAADDAGLPYHQMMENAGTLAAELILAELAKASWLPAYDVVFDIKPHVLIFCGKGNNGGDGFVVARTLSQQGFPVSVVLVEGPPSTPDAMANEMLLPKNVERISVNAFLETRLDAFPTAFSGIIVDSIYGTGFHGELNPKAAKVIEWMNHSPAHPRESLSPNFSRPVESLSPDFSHPVESLAPDFSHPGKPQHAGKMVVSLDLPSGLSGDMCPSDRIPDLCVNADHTIVFHALKPIHLCITAQPFLGKITIADIGISGVLK